MISRPWPRLEGLSDKGRRERPRLDDPSFDSPLSCGVGWERERRPIAIILGQGVVRHFVPHLILCRALDLAHMGWSGQFRGKLLSMARSFDLRFTYIQEETAFLKCGERHRMQHLLISGSIIFLLVGGIMWNFLSAALHHERAKMRLAEWDERWLFVSCGLALMTLALCLVGLVAARARARGADWISTEILVVTLYLGLLTWLSVGRHHTLQKLMTSHDAEWAPRVGGGCAWVHTGGHPLGRDLRVRGGPCGTRRPCGSSERPTVGARGARRREKGSVCLDSDGR